MRESKGLPEMDRAFAAWVRTLADAGAVVPAQAVLDRLGTEGAKVVTEAPAGPSQLEVDSWRVRLWLVPSEVRLGVREVAEALGRSTSWVYKRTCAKAEDRIPHRRLDGELVFTAGELRAWIREREDVLVAGPMDPPTLRAVS